MNATEKAIVRKHIRGIYNSWHCCAIGTQRNPITAAMKKVGVKAGDLCDTCEAMISTHMSAIDSDIRHAPSFR